MGDRFKRAIAFIIDWNICLLPMCAIVYAVSRLIADNPNISPVIVWPIMLLMSGSLVLFILRDVAFGSRSLGKRLFRLYVVDRRTHAPVDGGRRAARNIFFPLYPIDGIIMLITGDTIGGFATKTTVLGHKALESAQPGTVQKKKKTATAVVITVIAAIVLFIALLIGSIFGALSCTRDTEQYALAYEYLVESEAFERLGAEEEDIFHNRYSSFSSLTPDSENATQTVTIGFVVNGYPFEVVCHRIDGEWLVCEDCTNFR